MIWTINGRFLTQRTSGVQRFAREIVRALDHKLMASGCDSQCVLAMPDGADCDLALSAIRPQHIGRFKGHLWEQIDLYRATRGMPLVNLCNSGPVLNRRSLTIIHDAMVFRTPENFSRSYRLLHMALGRTLARRGRIGTVSEFSRRELGETIGARNVVIIPNSCEHMATILPDDDVLKRFGLTTGNYVMFVGSPTPNKNIGNAIAAIRLMGKDAPKFVIVGAAASAVFGDSNGSHAAAADDHIIFTGRLTDEAVVALYTHAAALVFPSLYEGFGIPPLEAMLLGCPVLSSDIDPAREACGDAALYFNAKDPEAIATVLREFLADPASGKALVERGRQRAGDFSWQRSANALLDAVTEL